MPVPNMLANKNNKNYGREHDNKAKYQCLFFKQTASSNDLTISKVSSILLASTKGLLRLMSHGSMSAFDSINASTHLFLRCKMAVCIGVCCSLFRGFIFSLLSRIRYIIVSVVARCSGLEGEMIA